MKISKELSDQIVDCLQQIKSVMNIQIGFTCKYGSFINENDDFILCEKEDGVYIAECNKYEIETNSFLVKVNSDFHKRSEKIDNFLIDYSLAIKEGKIILYPIISYKNWNYQYDGNGAYFIKKKDGTCIRSYHAKLDKFLPEDKELLEYIIGTLK